MVKVKLSLYQDVKLYGGVAVGTAPVHICRYIDSQENGHLSPSELSVSQK